MPTSKMYEPLKSVFQQAVAGLSKPTMFRMRPFRGNTCWSRLFICLLRQWRALKISFADIGAFTRLSLGLNPQTAASASFPTPTHIRLRDIHRPQHSTLHPLYLPRYRQPEEHEVKGGEHQRPVFSSAKYQ